MAAPTRIFGRARLLDTVFIGVDSDGTIVLNVHYLRRKLGKTVIRTVHGAGYRFGLE
jgi:DNA-binding response OmpR family regulator